MDLIEIERIARAIKKERFLFRIYTEGERERIAQRGGQTAAGFFAAKEAVAKALGTGFSGFGPIDIEVVNRENGAPECRLHGGAQARLREMGGARVLLSITHAGGMASAIAMAVSDDNL